MSLDRRSLLALGIAAVGPTAGRAQSAIPDKAVRLLLGAGTCGGIDQVARLIAPQLERRTGRHVVIEYRSGSTGATAAEALKNGPAEGSHLALMPSTMIAALLAPKDPAFDPLVDLAPISLVGSFPLALAVSPRIGVATVEEYFAWLKADPQRAALGTAATSDASIQLFARMLSQQLGTTMSIVGLRNPSAMMTDLESGRLSAGIAGVPTLLTAHRGGRVKILMISGSKPLKFASKLPTGDRPRPEGLRTARMVRLLHLGQGAASDARCLEQADPRSAGRRWAQGRAHPARARPRILDARRSPRPRRRPDRIVEDGDGRGRRQAQGLASGGKMFSHVTIGTNDMEKARRFYDGVAAAVGLAPLMVVDGGTGYGRKDGRAQLWIVRPLDKQSASAGNGITIGLEAPDRESVDAAFAAAMAGGGTDEGKPGIRAHYHPNYYGAYVRDPDGNKLCAVCHSPA